MFAIIRILKYHDKSHTESMLTGKIIGFGEPHEINP